MPDRNDFFGSGARSDWTRQPVTAPRSHLSGGTGLPDASNSRSSLDAARYDQQHYGQSTHDQPSHDATAYDQSAYDPSQYSSAQYPSAQYDQAQYQQPEYGQPHYDQSSYDQSQYGAAYQQHQYGSTPYDAEHQPGYESTGYAQPQTPAYDASYDQAHGATAHESAPYAASAYHPATPDPATFGAAGFESAAYESAPHDAAPSPAVGGFETVAPAEPEPVAPPQRATGFGQPGKSALDWTELTGAGNGRQSDGHQESTPIFDALVSAWFRKGSALFSKERKATKSGDPTAPDTANEPEAAWPSPADSGWQAADAVAHSKPDSFTTSGLPRRTPNARLLPGSMAGQNSAGRHLERKPEEMRSRLSDFQRGSNEGRHNVSTKRWTPVWNDEDGERESG